MVAAQGHGPGLRHLAGKAQALEALGNYQDADLAMRPADWGELPDAERGGADAWEIRFYDDADFWNQIFSTHAHGQPLEGREVWIHPAVVSQWVARIPGLYWRDGSERLREAAQANIEYESASWQTYTPAGKSQLVSGGIGTTRLPPSESGYRLVSLSASHNGSTGVPLLISEDDWDGLGLAEGDVVVGGAVLRRMPVSWAREFPSLKGLPKICLSITRPELLRKEDRGAPVQVHPFSVMEYTTSNLALLDFVFASADSTDPGFRERIEGFFECYCHDKGRNGCYLIAADVAEPMWDAVFSNPSEMRGAKKAELSLIEHRVREALNGEREIENVLQELVRHDNDRLLLLSEYVGFSQARWYQNGTTAAEAQRLVDAVIAARKLPELIQAMQMGY